MEWKYGRTFFVVSEGPPYQRNEPIADVRAGVRRGRFFAPAAWRDRPTLTEQSLSAGRYSSPRPKGGNGDEADVCRRRGTLPVEVPTVSTFGPKLPLDLLVDNVRFAPISVVRRWV